MRRDGRVQVVFYKITPQSPLNHPSGSVPTLITPWEEKERWKTSPEILTTLA